MSLINKMLQDLDARGSGAAASAGGSSTVRPVSAAARPLSRPLLALAAVAGIAVFIIAALFAWRALTRPSPSSLAAGAKIVAQPAATVPPAGQTPAAASPAAAATPPVAAQPSAPQPTPAAMVAAAAVTSEAAAKQAATPAPARLSLGEREMRRLTGAPQKSAAPARATAAEKAELKPRDDAGLTPSQRAENEYRRGLASMQEGRVHEAISRFEQALAANPRHEAARQTLVGLLIENQRSDEAMQHMQQALALEPAQAQMAMLLARLQMERGGPAIDTLQRTLPHAAANADYRAFLAGALQREQRHAEAVEQYQAALRLQAGNGVWWMGLGISLQALKRNAEARAAFSEAKATGRLSPELLAFVDRKLQQLPN